MRIHLPVACDPPGFLPLGVTPVFMEVQPEWTLEERASFTKLVDSFEVDEAVVLTVRIQQTYQSERGRDASFTAFIEDIRSGRVSGISEEQAIEDHVEDDGDEDPYICVIFEYETGEFSLFWNGLGEFDGWEGSSPQVVGEA